jgi:hypothetical protein
VGKKSDKAEKKGKRFDRGGSGRPRRPEPALDPLTIGTLIAAVIAGPPLWSLYRSGNLDLGTALLHWGLVAAGCMLGVTGVNRLIEDYRAQVDRERRIQEMIDALEDVVHEGLPIPAQSHVPGTPGQPGGTVPGAPGHPGTAPGGAVPGGEPGHPGGVLPGTPPGQLTGTLPGTLPGQLPGQARSGGAAQVPGRTTG